MLYYKTANRTSVYGLCCRAGMLTASCSGALRLGSRGSVCPVWWSSYARCSPTGRWSTASPSPMMAGTTRSVSLVLACSAHAQPYYQHFAASPTAETGAGMSRECQECLCSAANRKNNAVPSSIILINEATDGGCLPVETITHNNTVYSMLSPTNCLRDCTSRASLKGATRHT